MSKQRKTKKKCGFFCQLRKLFANKLKKNKPRLVYDMNVEFGTPDCIGRTPEMDLYEGHITQHEYDMAITKW